MSNENLKSKLDLLTQPLSKDDVEIRVGSCSKAGASFLLYKTARADTKRFNSVFGLNWKREHRIEAGHYVCRVSIYNEEIKEWISREDVGTESNTEKEKGAFSDSFKRAGFSFGFGIELYDAPSIFIKGITKEKQGGGKYELEDIFYTNNLVIQKYQYSLETGLQIEIYHTKEKQVVFSNFKSSFNKENNTTDKETRKQVNEPTVKIDFKEYKQKLLSSKSTDDLRINFKNCFVKKSEFTEAEYAELVNIKDNHPNYCGRDGKDH